MNARVDDRGLLHVKTFDTYCGSRLNSSFTVLFYGVTGQLLLVFNVVI